MKPEHIKTLQDLTQNKEKFLDKVAEIVRKKEFDFDIFFKAITDPQKLKIQAKWFAAIGCLFSSGKKDVKKNKKYAFSLYQHGAKLGCKKATLYCGLFYYDGRAGEENYQKAAEYFLEAIRLGNDNAHYYFALVSFRQGDLDTARINFDEVSYKNKNYIKAQFKLIEIYIKQKSYQDLSYLSEYLFSVIEKNEDDFKEVKGFFKKLFKKLTASFKENREDDNHQDTIEICKAIAGTKFQPALYLLGNIYLSQNKYGEALKYFRKIDSTFYKYEKAQTIIQEKYHKALEDIYDHESGQEIKSSAEDLPIVVNDKRWKPVHRNLTGFTGDNDPSEKVKEQLAAISPLNSKLNKRKLETESRFFNPKRLKYTFSRQFSHDILTNRLANGNKNVSEISISAQPARRLITAERATQQAAITLFGFPEEEFGTELGYFENPKNAKSRDVHNYYTDTKLKYVTSYSNIEKLNIESNVITYKQRISPNYNRLGDCFFNHIGDYASILSTIQWITGQDPEREKQLAILMVRFSHDGKALTFNEIAKLVYPDQEPADLNNTATECVNRNLKLINEICYLIFVKEVSQWQLPKEEKWNLPFATAQARALILLTKGLLRMADVFGPDAPYGIFTGNNLIKKNIELIRKINQIDDLYTEYLKQQHFKEYMQFFKNHNNNNATVIATRQRIRQDLQEIYGGENDTDGEGYESEGNIATLQLPTLK